jgi:ATP-binding cassette, subfamily B, bacterial PglK
MSTVLKIKYLLNKGEKFSLNLILLFILITSLLETLGIGLIIPVIKVIFSQNLDSFLISLKEFFLIKHFIDYLITFERVQLIVLLLSILCFFYLIKSVMIVIFIWLREIILDKINDRLTGELFNKYLNQEYTFHTKNNSADLIRNVSAVQAIKNSLNYILNVASEIIFLIFIISFLIYIEPLGSLLILFFTASICLFYFLFFREKLNELGKSNLEYSSIFHRVIMQSLEGFKLVKLYKFENFFSNSLKRAREKLSNISRSNHLVTISSRYVLEVLAVLMMSLLLFFVSENGNTENTIMVVAVFTLAGFKIIPSANKILMGLNNLKYSVPPINLIYNDFQLKNEKDEDIKNCEFEFKDKIKFINVSYCYPNKKKAIINDFNYEIQKGDIIGVIGSSGSGKSTFLNLLSGLAIPSSGKILIDENDLVKVRNRFFKEVSYITQKPFLFDDTIENNIIFGNPKNKINEKLIKKCIEEAQLKMFINHLPNGLKTPVGERGSQLSGGQAQRITIARALYKQSNILIFDEPTSSLDEQNEKNFFDIIYKQRGIKTIVISSHKKDILNKCDKIIDLGGNI